MSPGRAENIILANDPLKAPAGLENGVYAIGNFDGVHRGHAAVIGRARRLADELGAPAAALTFEPHPADFFAGRPVVFRLTPPPLKARALAELGVDGVVTLTFNAALAGLTAEAFVSTILVGRLGIGAAVIGGDFHFGKNRGGSPEFLVEAGRRHGFRVDVIEKVADSGGEAAISSTAIRRALEAGDVETAAGLLGRPYCVEGEVIAGRKLGRTLGLPTANIALAPTNRLAHGVYAVRATAAGKRFDGVASFGTRPTVEGAGAPLLEVFLFDFSGDLYGKTMDVAFEAYLRPELKFESLEALKARMAEDVERARIALRSAPDRIGPASAARP
ncbi:MAG TPA: bifunctional riboflavin kinase/FAD synthetase [Roseiarcus sp.]|nr:bifunctional riboflavin kinase/FAD synthetase [Roseiarcus sp.]